VDWIDGASLCSDGTFVFTTTQRKSFRALGVLLVSPHKEQLSKATVVDRKCTGDRCTTVYRAHLRPRQLKECATEEISWRITTTGFMEVPIYFEPAQFEQLRAVCALASPEKARAP
jgi:hypothetical protein